MTDTGAVRSVRELPESPRPNYFRVRRVRDVPLDPSPHESSDIRLIYFDHCHAAETLEQIASTSSGRAMLDKLTEAEFASNQRAILLQLIAKVIDLNIGEIIDLHQLENASRRTSWNQLHPDQAVAIRGAVTSTKDVQPSSLRLEAGIVSVRVFIQRDHFLHLNQSYLNALPITIIGKVRSVPRIEICAAAIGASANNMR